MSDGEKKSFFGHSPDMVRKLGKLHVFAGVAILAASALIVPVAVAGAVGTFGAYEVANGMAHGPLADALEPKPDSKAEAEH